MDGIMQKLVIVWILLPIIRCSQPEECSRTGKKASLEFYYYYNRFSNQIIHIETTANLLSQSQVDDADIVYRLSGNKINGRTLGVLNVRCVKLKSNLTSCPSKLQSN
jgi:predicted lipoprotein